LLAVAAEVLRLAVLVAPAAIELDLCLFQQHLMLSRLVLAVKAVEDILVHLRVAPEEIIVYFQASLLQEVVEVEVGLLQ
jgi:hypothetical protein